MFAAGHGNMLDDVLTNFGFNPAEYQVVPLGSGLINSTFKVTGNGDEYILQRINDTVFKSPGQIANNLNLLQEYFKDTHPSYLFVGPLPTISGDYLFQTSEGVFYRMFPFIKDSHTVNVISVRKEAFEAAKQFGRFTALLDQFDASTLEYTLPDFHNLNLRSAQFKAAIHKADPERLLTAAAEIEEANKHRLILQTYYKLITNKQIPIRAIHHDTKISNVLFDDEQNGLCVIDLDTVMPGYYLSDIGDMMRTYLSPANEEETDLTKVYIREDIFSAVCEGYLSEMGSVLTEKEKQHLIFSGKMMIYMQALRFLTDHLNNDIYYKAQYPGHNLARAKNQFKLLNEYVTSERKFKEIIS